MRITIDTTSKTVILTEAIKFTELVEFMEQLSGLGSWDIGYEKTETCKCGSTKICPTGIAHIRDSN